MVPDLRGLLAIPERVGFALRLGRTRWTAVQLATRRNAAIEAVQGTAGEGSIAVVLGADLDAVAVLLAAIVQERPVLLLGTALSQDDLHPVLRTMRPAALFAPSIWIDRLPPADGWTRVAGLGSLTVFTQGSHQSPALPPGTICGLTSGSTDMPRVAVRTAAGIALEVVTLQQAMRVAPGERLLVASSIAHSYGLVGGLLTGLASGAEVVLATGPEDGARLARAAQPAVVLGLASTYRMLAAQGPLPNPPRLAFSAGAPLPNGLFSEVAATTGIAIRQDYGTTETGTIALDLADEPDPESVGTVLPHLEARLAEHFPYDTPELLVRSLAVAPWYLNDTAGLERTTDAYGWFRTRDAAACTYQSLRLGGRLRDPLTIDGLTVPPERIERVLRGIPGVVETAAWVDGDGVLRAAVVAPDVGAEAIVRDARGRLAPHEVPQSIRVWPSFPRSPAGKLLYRHLR